MTTYIGTWGDSVPPQTKVTFETLGEYVEYRREGSETRRRMDPFGIVGPVDKVRAVDTEYGEYNSKGEYIGGRQLNDEEIAKLKELEG